MKPLTYFLLKKQEMCATNFYLYCKVIVTCKTKNVKIVVQKAQQYIDTYKQKNSIATTTES
jgi:hypothetical protein